MCSSQLNQNVNSDGAENVRNFCKYIRNNVEMCSTKDRKFFHFFIDSDKDKQFRLRLWVLSMQLESARPNSPDENETNSAERRPILRGVWSLTKQTKKKQIKPNISVVNLTVGYWTFRHFINLYAQHNYVQRATYNIKFACTSALMSVVAASWSVQKMLLMSNQIAYTIEPNFLPFQAIIWNLLILCFVAFLLAPATWCGNHCNGHNDERPH